MHFTRHPLPLALLAIALLAPAACKQSRPLATSTAADAASAPVDVEAAAVTAPTPAADASTATTPATETAAAPIEVTPVVADKAAKEAVIAAMASLKALRSYRMTTVSGDGATTPTTTTVDYVAPDRYRMETAGVPVEVAVGEILYITDAAGTRAGPAPARNAQWRDPGGLLAAGSDFTAEKGPRRFVFAMPATEYKLHVTRPVASNMNLWIGPKGLPIKLERQGLVGGKLVTTLVRYSHFDSEDIKIVPPK